MGLEEMIIRVRGRGAILFGIFFLFLLLPSCRRKESDYLMRYRYRPGEILRYGISLQGEGLVKIATITDEEAPKETKFPVLINGVLLLEASVRSVSDRNVAVLALAYKDLDFKITNRIQDREINFVLNDRQMVMRQGDKVLNVAARGTFGYPLNGIVGNTFTVEIDDRGEITRLEGPGGFTRSFPYLDFTGLLDQVQPDFPEAAVRVGESWRREVDVSVPGLGMPWDKTKSWKMQLLSRFRGFADDKEGEVALVDLTGKLDQEAGKAAGSGSAIDVERANHKIDGEFGFDLQAGKVLFSRTSLEQELDIRVESDKEERHGELDVHVTFQVEIKIKLIKD